MICSYKVGLDANVENMAGDIQFWIQALVNYKKAVLWASREAKKAVLFFESNIKGQAT